MTKFALILVVCTAVYNDCDPGMRHENLFNTWKECMMFGHKEATNLMEQQPNQYANENKIYIKFFCDEKNTF